MSEQKAKYTFTIKPPREKPRQFGLDVDIRDQTGLLVSTVQYQPPEIARLIAAAPSLYEALKAVEFGAKDQWGVYCPSCKHSKGTPKGIHFTDCQLRAVLDMVEEA